MKKKNKQSVAPGAPLAAVVPVPISIADVEKWILSWPEWERELAETLLREEMSPGAFKEKTK